MQFFFKIICHLSFDISENTGQATFEAIETDITEPDRSLLPEVKSTKSHVLAQSLTKIVPLLHNMRTTAVNAALYKVYLETMLS